MFLIDTNCFIQIVRSRPQEPQVRALLDGVPRSRLLVTDFTLHSIGVIMSRFKQIEGYIAFVDSVGIGHEVRIIRNKSGDLGRVAAACKLYRLDFDDAYQCVAAETNDLTIVSLDDDFDRTPNGRLTPAAALQQYLNEQNQQQQQKP